MDDAPPDFGPDKEADPSLPAGAEEAIVPTGGHHRRTIAVLRLLALASVGLPIVLLVVGGLLAWQSRQQEAWNRTVRLADLTYESVSKLIEAQILGTEQAALMVDGMDDATIAADQLILHERLQAMLRHLPHLREIFVVSQSGRALVSGSRYPAPTPDGLRSRDYYQHFSAGGAGLFIGQPAQRYVDDLKFFPLAIRRPSGDGRFIGLVAASVNPDYFQDFFRQTIRAYADADGRNVSLRRGDGLLLVRAEPVQAKDERDGDIFAAGILAASGTSGRLISTWMGQTRLVAWRRLPGVDMVVISSVAQTAVLRAWTEIMLPYLCVGLFAMVSLLSMTLLALRHTRLAEAAQQQTEAERKRRRQAEDAIRQGQKMEALGKLTGGVAHDFNNLLAVILGSAELAKRRPPDKVLRLLDNIIYAGQRGATLTRQLLSFSRSQALQPKVLDPYAELPRMMALLQPSLSNDIAIETDVAQDVWLLEVDPTEWEIALLNIAANARDAMPEGGQLRVEAGNLRIARGTIAGAPELEGDYVRIALCDTGCGIPPDVAARAFEPFYTTKDVGRGSGLGLSQVYGFARQAGGAVTIETSGGHVGTTPPRPSGKNVPGPSGTNVPGPSGTNVPGPSGTIVTLYLPRSHAPLDTPLHPLAAEQAQETSARRVLVVEDNPEVAAITIEMIQSLGYEVVHADRARAALDLLMQPGPSFHLMLSDVVMPDNMNGLELATIVRRRLPNLPIILMSGYNDSFSQLQPDFRILRKPLPVQQLSQAIAAEVGAWPRMVVDNTAGGISSGHSRTG